MPGGIHPPPEQWLIWPVLNYAAPETKPNHVFIAACIFAPLSTLLLLIRTWVRVKIQSTPGWDDWLMLASFFFALSTTIISVWCVQRVGFNRHIYDIELRLYPIQRYYVLAQYILFTMASGLIKMSVLLFYRRLSARTVSPAFRWTLRIMITFIALHTVVFSIVPVFLCRPIAAFWNQVDLILVAKGYDYKCSSEGAEVVANCVLSTIQDFITAALPSFLCWNLQIPKPQKIALYTVFAVSYLTVAVGAVRTYLSYRIFFKTYDVTWAAGDLWLFSVLEINIGSMCANAPTLKAFYSYYFTRKTSRIRSRPAQHSNSDSNPESFRSRASTRLSESLNFKKLMSSSSNSGYLSTLDSTNSTARDGVVEMETRHTSQQQEPRRIEADHRERVNVHWDEEIGYAPSETNVPAPGHDISALPPMPVTRPVRTFMFWKWRKREGAMLYE